MFSYAATHDFIRKTAIDFNLHIKLLTYKAYENRFDFNRTSYGDKTLPMIEIACVGQHLFAIKPTKVSMAAIKYPEFANHADFPSLHVRNGRIAKGEPKLLMSHQVIGQLYFNKDDLLTPITLANAPELHNNKYGQIDFLDESALTNNWFREIGATETFGSEPFTKRVDGETIAEPFQNVYFDLETFHDSKKNIASRMAKAAEQHYDGNHIAYCAAWKIGDGPTQHAYGFNCVKTMLDSLPNKGNYLMWAHNAGFDSRFLIRLFSSFEAQMGVIETGNSMKYLAGTYKDRRIVIKDTKAFLATALAKMPAMFPGACNESTLEKESFPHDMMNAKTFDGQLSLSSIKVEFDDYDNLVKNASKIGATENDMLDVPKYAIHYCKRDVDVLYSCSERFRKQMLDRFNQDIYNHISMPGLAYAILNNMGCYENCYSMAGPCLELVRKAIVGGRVMTRDNKKWHVQVFETYSLINGERVEHHKTQYTSHEKSLIQGAVASEGISDFDAVSLYPSAMARLPGFTQGKPKLHANTIPDCDYHISKVKITSISKKLHFPLLSVKEEGASRNFTNDIVGREFVLDKYALEDLVKFQGATYEVIQGLYWNDGFNTAITTSIKELFEERLKLKAEKNPLQNGIKLLMNASYGKLIQKPIVKSKRFIRGKKAIEEYTIKRIGRLIQRTPVSDDIALFEEHKPLNKHFSPAHLGVQILSMSKRIMNEVMCLAEDLDLKIWYQDTDSMHINRQSLPILSNAFREKYNRELVGKGMGQFHSDFELEGSRGEVFATESYFIGKKTYVDFLKCTENDVEGVHKRMKGIPSKLITDPRKTYKGLYDGIDQEFDMTAACPIQVDNKSQRVSRRKAFIRIVKA
ncbi:unnamed protein product [Phytophthora lilii]|uniref:DNA-directed DNA polymerase n=1 Tax=Phytophthora lilii TaxID=2077276 RepID=A0A9W6YIH8_9STRA|nr:unnamed protein product [Phytophthora lilii]